MKIGQRLKERRKELKMSADELAKKLGKDRSTIYRYEKGEIENLPLDILEPIAKALDTTPQYLMGWVEPTEEDKKNNDILADIIIRLRTDKDLMLTVEKLCQLDKDELDAINRMLDAFKK